VNDPSENLVDLVRHFLDSHARLRRLFAHYRGGELRWGEVDDLIDDHERSVLFRLKERCHALFRDRSANEASMRREALLDLAVGSLFHEAMKFRENFYQREVYGPKVRALRRSSADEADALFREFERILGASSVRIEEALQETETLLAQTREQLRLVLADFREDGLVARTLVDHADEVAEVFGLGLDALFEEIHGEAAEGYARAAISRLESGHFARAREDIEQALCRAGGREDLRRLAQYAEGMEAFRSGRYAEAVRWLRGWIEAGLDGSDAARVGWAHGALSRISPLLEPTERASLAAQARELVEALQSYEGGSPARLAARA
jgi:hypothetical protein